MSHQRFTPIRLLASIAIGASVMSAPAHAQLARSFTSATYTGVGVSRLDSDFKNLKAAYDLDAIGGYNLVPAQPWGRLSAELNLGVTVAPGKNEGARETTVVPGTGGGLIGGGSGDTTTTESGKFTESSNALQALLLSVLGTYRSPGRLYGIASAGGTLQLTSIEEIEENGRLAFTFGGGVGFKFGEETAAVELVYSRVSEDLQTVGLRFVY